VVRTKLEVNIAYIENENIPYEWELGRMTSFCTFHKQFEREKNSEKCFFLTKRIAMGKRNLL